MEYIFNNRKKTLNMVEGAYKKLKSYLYYDKTLIFAKKRVAELEKDREYFQTILAEITNNLMSRKFYVF